MSELLLGKSAKYDSKYNPDLLFPIPRSKNREKLPKELIFHGVDIWNCYEVSWLNQKSKPEVRILELYIDADSPNIVESKSLKLYLNSLNNEKFDSDTEVLNVIKNDIEKTIGARLEAIFRKMDYFKGGPFGAFEAISIDDIDIECLSQEPSKDLLKIEESEVVEEILYSDLLKSNCLITHQPDWASIKISYKGPKIDHASLLQYFVSFRNHNEFHEDCVETIYSDIITSCKCQKLTVYARYTRRGGVDINPLRSSEKIIGDKNLNDRLPRQ